MTGHLTANVTQAHLDDMLRQAEHHRMTHAAMLDRLSGRWIPFRTGRARTGATPALVTTKPCA